MLHYPMWEIHVALAGKGTAPTRAVLPIPASVCSTFMHPNNWYGCQSSGLLMDTQVLMHATAHGRCTDCKRV